ncbi:hypothetical protein Hamer_G000117, partial [Homarus americanus]
KCGKVEGVRLNKYTKGPAAILLNGTRTFKVNLKNNIPSSVTVGGHSLTFLYAGQRKTCYKYGHEGHLAIDCHTKEIVKVSIYNEEDFPAIQLSGEIQSARPDVKEGKETRYGIEREVPAQTIIQDAVDSNHATHPDGSENAVQETSTTFEAEIHTERNTGDQTKGKISYGNMEFDKTVDDMEPINMTETYRMEKIVELTCTVLCHQAETRKMQTRKIRTNQGKIT